MKPVLTPVKNGLHTKYLNKYELSVGFFESFANQVTALSDAMGFERRDLKADVLMPVDFVRGKMLTTTFKWDFDEIERFVLFVGYPRSGHSLVGSLLDAHPDVAISHELDALRYLRAGFTRDQIFSLILHKDKEFTGKGREWTGYDYNVPGLWQGRYRKLKIIGDKKGGGTARHLIAKPTIIEDLRKKVELPLRLIHIVRHPLDNIATHFRKKKPQQTMQEAIDDYFRRADANYRTSAQVEPEEWIDMKHEEIIENPKKRIGELCEFMGVDADKEYLEACASKVFKSPSRSRDRITWQQEYIDQVADRAQKYPFLQDYEISL